VTRCERRRERAPVLDRPTEPMHENERRAVPADGVAKPRSVPLELALLETAEALFALCRH